jgi:hypothetical protein
MMNCKLYLGGTEEEPQKSSDRIADIPTDI